MLKMGARAPELNTSEPPKWVLASETSYTGQKSPLEAISQGIISLGGASHNRLLLIEKLEVIKGRRRKKEQGMLGNSIVSRDTQAPLTVSLSLPIYQRILEFSTTDSLYT